MFAHHPRIPRSVPPKTGRAPHINTIQDAPIETIVTTRSQLVPERYAPVSRRFGVEALEWIQAIAEAALIYSTVGCIVWIITYFLLLIGHVGYVA